MCGLLFSFYKMILPANTYFTVWHFALTVVIFALGGLIVFATLYFIIVNLVFPRYLGKYI